ncbi:MAG: type II toxin-antitoxin system HicB family antitoxin [Bacillota bacterium]|jgi:predicted RNase H-like HicB family nuclease
MIKVYPIILEQTKDGYVVTVPDLDINTQGKDLAEAIYMARDAIGIWGICEQDAGRKIPEPSTVEPPHKDNKLISWVDIDFDDYRKKTDMAAVRTNVTIPRYLKTLAEEAGVNFSQILQEGLKQHLNIR